MKISTAQLTAILLPFDGYQFATVEAEKTIKTLKKDRKTGAPFNGIITCRAIYNGGIGYEYAKSVNNKRKREDSEADFQPLQLPWGNWVKGSKVLIENKGKTYLRQTLNASNPVRKVYYLNGVETAKNNLPDVLPSSKPSTSRQGLENPVIVVTHDLSNIVRLSFNGKTYEIE